MGIAISFSSSLVAMSVPPRGATGNCLLLRAEPNTDIRMQATGPSDRPAYEHLCHIIWMMTFKRFRDNATASAGADAHSQSPANVKSKNRVATLNVGTLTGRSCELVEALERRKIDFCAVQETRWSCKCKSRDIGRGFKAVLCGSPKTTSGVGMIVSERFRDAIASVERFDDRLMKIVVAVEERRCHFFSAYAPQTGCSEQTKDEFWSLLDEKTAEVPSEDMIVVAGDFNGHVGATKDGYSCHGGFGYGFLCDTGDEMVLLQLSSNQCGFVAGCGTIDAIHVARLLLEKHREKQKPVHIAFLDLEKAFGRLAREVIWYVLRHHGVPEEIIEWVRILYSCPKSRVQAAAGTSMEFPISVGVHQSSALSPLLFVVLMDAITRYLQSPVPWTMLYADDVMLASEDKAAWLKLNVKKTEYLTTDSTESCSIKVNGIELPRTSVFKYLGSAVASDDNLMTDMNSRNSCPPVAIYGAECWPVTKEIERRLSVVKTKMLRWTAGVTRMDLIRNDAIRQKFGVAPIADKMREARLRWYGNVLRGKEDSVRKMGLNLEVIGKRPRGRPKQRWSDTLNMDLKVAGVHPDLALDRE
ncbi:unnamed protein product [Heligmosomoides polygyrus]|uniref:Reverse transcriptase domain-containing protein n=1 Tax=Heligmosomoides polygyrus TaxID=6339 RepID=A0A183GJH0_HELPZ|nr:unnamed protein product [Heligmosomoides polygyrus]